MKRLLTALMGILLFAAFSDAGTIPVVGTILNANGSRFNGTVRMTLNYPATDTSAGNIVVPQTATFRVNNGTVQSGAAITPNDVLAPANTIYVTAFYSSAGQMVRQNNFYVSTGSQFNLGTATPTALTSSNISFNTFTGLTDVESAIINNRQTCARSGASAGAKIIAAIAALPSTGGTVDCQLPGNQTISSNVFAGVTKPVRLLLGAGNYTISATQTVTNPYTSIIGLGPFVTNITCSENADCLQITANPWSIDQGGTIAGFTVTGNAGSAAVGVHMSGITGSALRDLVITGFTGTTSAGLWLDHGAAFADINSPPTHANFVERTETLAVWLKYNTVGLKMTAQAAATSPLFDFMHFLDTRFNVGAGQIGILFDGTNGTQMISSEFQASMNCNDGGTMMKVTGNAVLFDANLYKLFGETTSGAACVGLQVDAGSLMLGIGIVDFANGGSTAVINGTLTVRDARNNPGSGYATPFIEQTNIFAVRSAVGAGGYGTYIMPDLGGPGGYFQGIGQNLYFDGTNYKALGNGVTNGAAGLLFEGSSTRLIVTPSTGGTTNTISPASLAGEDRFSCSEFGCKIGSINAGATLLTIVLSASGNLNFGTVNANTCADVTFSLSGAAASDSYYVTAPVANVPTGIVLNVYGASGSAPTVRACNITTGNIVVGTINTVRVDAWRH